MVPSLPVFGSPLVTALARSSFTTPSGLSIPGVLARIYHEIEEKGLDIEGIFRKSGSTAAVNQLQQQFEKNQNPFLVKFPSTVSTHSLAGLFKRYLQQLPEPVIPRQHQPFFLNVFDEEKCTKETLKRRLKEVCKTLPHGHLHLLQFLMEVCDMIQQRQSKNQMSVESLAIIFAPTCVHIDGVSQLMPSSSSYSSSTSSLLPTSNASLPILLNKQQLLFRKARKLILNTLQRKRAGCGGISDDGSRVSYHHSQETLLYKPNELLQLELVKESNTWIRIFEFMMSYPEVFTALTNPLKSSQKYQQRSTLSVKTSSGITVEKKTSQLPPPPPSQQSTATTTIPDKPAEEELLIPQEKKLLVDLSSFEFTDSSDLIKTFEKFEINFDHILSSSSSNNQQQQQSNKKTSTKRSSTTPTQQSNKYVETLLNWKSREEENPHVIIPSSIVAQEVVVINKRLPTSPQPSDWVKAINSGVFITEPKEKKKIVGRQTNLFSHHKQTTTPPPRRATMMTK